MQGTQILYTRYKSSIEVLHEWWFKENQIFSFNPKHYLKISSPITLYLQQIQFLLSDSWIWNTPSCSPKQLGQGVQGKNACFIVAAFFTLEFCIFMLRTVYPVPCKARISCGNEAAIFLSWVGQSPPCTSKQNVCDGTFNLREAAKRCSQVASPTSIQLLWCMWTQSLDLSQIWIQRHVALNLQSDITTRLHCSVQASMTLRAAGEWEGTKSTVVTNLSLHQTNRRALDLQNNQQPAKRFEQTPAGCHSEEQMPFLKK